MSEALRMSYDAASIKNLRWQVIQKKRKLLTKKVDALNEKMHTRRNCDKTVHLLMQDLRDVWEEETMLEQEDMTNEEIKRKNLDPDDSDLEDYLEDEVDWTFDDFIDHFCTFYPNVKWAMKELHYKDLKRQHWNTEWY